MSRIRRMIDRPGVWCAAVGVGVALVACGSPGPPDPVPACSLLTEQEVGDAIGVPAAMGHIGPSVSDMSSDGCWFNSSKGFVSVWSKRADAADAYRGAREVPARQPQQDFSGTEYQGFAYTSPANLQEVHILKNRDYIYVTVGAGATPGTARRLGEIAVARLP